jgi:tetratricopeptide (TPR) repeat protein
LWRASVLSLIVLMVALLVPAAPAQAQSRPADPETGEATHARKLFVRGMTRAFLEDYQAAIAYYQQALELSPQEASILSAMADAQAAESDASSALYYAEKARDYAPQNSAYHVQLAALQREAGRLDAAINTYERMLERFPKNVDARMALAETQVEAQQPHDAIDTYEALLERGADNPRIQIELLQLYRQVDDPEGIERTLKALISLRPDDQLYVHLLGQLYSRQGRTGDAITLFEKLLARQPANVDVVMQLTALYRDADRNAEAESLLRRFVDDETASPDQLVARARSLVRSAQAPSADDELRETAARLLQRALEASPDHAEALALLGDLRYAEGNYPRAAELLEAALQQNPRSPERWTRAAAALLRSGQTTRAVEVADEGLLLFPGQFSLVRVSAYANMRSQRNAVAASRFEEAIDLLDSSTSTAEKRGDLYTALGLVYARLQKHQKSDAAYARALDADPNQATAANNYAYSLAERGEHLDRALKLAQRAVDADSTNPAYLDTLGWVYFKRKQYEKAREVLRQALETGDATASVYEHFGDVHEALGDLATAKEYWQQALQRAPDRDAVQDKLNALQD